ncbi:MAG: zinc carboxypeptidase [Candidatus Riflebacteria bacterium]|nr:zinc carboxypeptidase [Candidatus Riflebacteria bacterium]
MRLFSVLLCAILVFFACTELHAGDPRKIVRIDGLSSTEVSSLGAQGYDIARAGEDFAEIVVSQNELKKLTKLHYKKSKLTVLVADVGAYINKVLADQTPGAEYYTYERLVATLNQWAEQYPTIAKLYSIGKSSEGRDILAMKISDNPDVNESEPAAFINGGHHAREWISIETPMEAMKQLLEGYGKDSKLTQLVNTRETWFIPVVNPDGWIYSQTQSKFWRKNRRQIDSVNFGVDLNRNYSYKWGNSGASEDPSADTYAGPNAFSEPETQAIKALCERERFQTCLSFHSYSELNLYPFSYAKAAPNPDKSKFQYLAQDIGEFNHYMPQNSAELYPASGVIDDWIYTSFKTMAITIELGKTFIPPANQIAEINKLNVPAVFLMMEKAGTYGITTPGNFFNPESLMETQTGIAALVDGADFLDSLSTDHQLKTIDKLQKIGLRVSELTALEMLSGNSTTWNVLQDSPSASFVIPLVKNRLKFAEIHDK